MKLRNGTEHAIYGAAFERRLTEELRATGRASAIAATSKPEDRDAARARFDATCADVAIGYAESVVELHRRARKARR